jgi:hypothetical protein
VASKGSRPMRSKAAATAAAVRESLRQDDAPPC